MEVREAVNDFFVAHGLSEERAAHEANDLIVYKDAGEEMRIRGKLLAIQREMGFSQEDIQPVWDILGLEYGMPVR